MSGPLPWGRAVHRVDEIVASRIAGLDLEGPTVRVDVSFGDGTRFRARNPVAAVSGSLLSWGVSVVVWHPAARERVAEVS